MSEAAIPTKPYMLRAMYEWCVDNGFTPHLVVAVDARTRVPHGHVKDGQIVLNINDTATRGLRMENEAISFSARFGGVSTDIYIPVDAVRGIFARENGQGMFFEAVAEELAEHDAKDTGAAAEQTPFRDTPTPGKKPSLKLVK